MITKMLRKLRLASPALAAALAIATLAACGGAAQPATDAPQPTASQATAAPAATADTPPALLRAAPAFQLPDTSGETVSLDSYIGNKNVVVVFYRGFW